MLKAVTIIHLFSKVDQRSLSMSISYSLINLKRSSHKVCMCEMSSPWLSISNVMTNNRVRYYYSFSFKSRVHKKSYVPN